MILSLEKCDVNQVMKIWLDENISAHNFIPESYWRDNYDFVKNNFILSDSCETYVHKIGDKVTGFISITDIDRNECSCYIGAIFVDESFQGKGIGKSLIEKIQANFQKATLGVYKENIKATNFYLHRQFTIIGEEEDDKNPGHIICNMKWNCP